MQRSALCRSRRELSNAYFLAKFCLNTAENEPCQVCPIPRNAAPTDLAELQAARLVRVHGEPGRGHGPEAPEERALERREEASAGANFCFLRLCFLSFRERRLKESLQEALQKKYCPASLAT